MRVCHVVKSIFSFETNEDMHEFSARYRNSFRWVYAPLVLPQEQFPQLEIVHSNHFLEGDAETIINHYDDIDERAQHSMCEEGEA